MTWPTGFHSALKSAVLVLALPSAGCTTVIVENPEVNIDFHVAIPPPSTPKPLVHAPIGWPGNPQPPILRETTTE